MAVFDFSEECARAAADYGVSAAIDHADHIFRFLCEHPDIGPKAPEHYFSDGRDSAMKLRALIEEQRPLGSISILEFAAGYGRVTRHFARVLPEATCVACDIHDGAVRFLAGLGVEARGSSAIPEDFALARSFDVVFALSFFSHLPQATWTRWLRRLIEHTADGGLMIFTTHGERSRSLAAPGSIVGNDFFFHPASEQLDLPSEQYGTALTPFAFVYAQIASMDRARLIKFQEGYWWTHQDVYVIKRD